MIGVKTTGSVTITQGIRVAVAPSYLAEQSEPDEGRYFFGYRIRITNESTERVQLMRREWTIIDGDGERAEVEGEGVVGQQPILEPGQSYVYSSFCPLGTPWGTMEGWYIFRDHAGEEFRVRIGRFFLVMTREAAADA